MNIRVSYLKVSLTSYDATFDQVSADFDFDFVVFSNYLFVVKNYFYQSLGNGISFSAFLVSQFVTYVFDLAGKKLLFASIKDLL